MAYKCDLCGKGQMILKTHRHHRGVAGGKWKQRAHITQKVSLPNLHAYKMVVDGEKVKVKLCTKCLRLAKKSNQSADSPAKTAEK